MTGVPGAGAVAAVYGLGPRVRNWLFDRGHRAVHRLPVPVVSIGNLTVGGTGKTPMTEEVARLLSDEGWSTCILSRGYGGTRPEEPLVVSDHWRVLRGPSEAGDEPFLLARRLPGVSVVVGRDRHEAGRHALEQLPVNLFVLDDGFQHRGLHRDVDIVLLDATDPWGGGALLPAGRLREPVSALSRADAIVVTRLHQAGRETLERLAADLKRLAPDVPSFGARTQAIDLRPVPRGPAEPLGTLADQRVLAFCGIARPDSFFADLENAGARIAARRAFRDHHPYSGAEVRRLAREGDELGVAAMVTTEKDAVRLPPMPPSAPPLLALRSRVALEKPDAFLQFLATRLPGPTRGGQPLG